MASYAKWILPMAVLAVIIQEAAATARDLAAPSPMDVTNTVTLAARNEDNVFQWLKITAVPFVVCLVGACTWGLIKNTALWKGLTGVEVSAPQELTTNFNLSSNRIAPDLEVKLEVSQRRNMDDEDLAPTPALDLTIQHPAVEAPQDDGESAVSEETTQFKRCSTSISVCTSNIIQM